jgi:uncharacterized protein YuzE
MKYLNYLPVVLNNNEHLIDVLEINGAKIHLSVHNNGKDAEYWTNVDCTVYEDYKSWKKGDRVFIKYNEMRNVFGSYGDDTSSRIIYNEGIRICLIDSNYVYLTIRDGKYIPQDGFSLVEPVLLKKQYEGKIILLELEEEDKYEEDIWKVIAVGGKSPDSESIYGTDAIPQEGWYIKSKTGAGMPLEASLNKRLSERFFMVRHNEVMAYEVRE